MLQILVVCGAGLGSSFVCQMTVESVLKDLGIEAKVDHSDISSAAGTRADIVMAAMNFKKQFERYDMEAETIFIERLVDKEEVKEKLIPVLKKLGKL